MQICDSQPIYGEGAQGWSLGFFVFSEIKMSVSKLLDDFSKIEKVPVSVDMVVAELRARDITDKISYIRDETLDPRIVRGYLYRTRNTEDGSYESAIVHARMSEGEERIVSTKELIHILDPERLKVSEEKRLKDLFSKIVLPPEVADIAEEGEHVSTDRDAIFEAVALLFPLAARNKIYADYMQEKVSIEWIADKVEIPVEYALPVMNGYWPAVVRTLIARRIRLEDSRKEPVAPSYMDPKSV